MKVGNSRGRYTRDGASMERQNKKLYTRTVVLKKKMHRSYISKGSCVRASRPPRAVWLSRRIAKPPPPGPRGCLMIPLLGWSIAPLRTLEGRLGTGGIVPLPKLNRLPNPPGERRDGDAMVA